MELYSDVYPLLDAMTRDLLKMTETIVQLRSKLSAAGMFPVQELHSDLSCAYSDFKVWNDFVEVYFDGTDPFVGELLASGENNLHESGEINQKKSKEKSHYQF